MAVTAFVLIKTAHGKNRIVAKRLEKVDEIIDLNELFGRYDIIAKVSIENVAQLQAFMQNKLWIIEGINNTETLIVSSEDYKQESTDADDEGFEGF